MPFVARSVEPRWLSRRANREDDGDRLGGQELQAVTNRTLSNALRQLASLVLLAEDVFGELTSQLHTVSERSSAARIKIERLTLLVDQYDPKKVPVRKYLHFINVIAIFN